MTPSVRRPIRIGGASGGFTDRVAAISRLASDPAVDAVVGDWLSENVMTGYGAGKVRQELSRPNATLEERKATGMFASTFLQCFEPAIDNIVMNRTKVVVNAGASDTQLLAEVVQDMLQRRECGDIKVAWVEGDDVTEPFKGMIREGHVFKSLTDGKTLEEWGYEPICAQAYLGSLGIAEALRQGADIVICGRYAPCYLPYLRDTSDLPLECLMPLPRSDSPHGGTIGVQTNGTNSRALSLLATSSNAPSSSRVAITAASKSSWHRGSIST